MKTITKLIYFAVALIVTSNMILNYSVVDLETGIIIFTMDDFTFVVYPLIHQTASFIATTLDTGLLIVLLSLQKLQNNRHLKDNSSLETKLNLMLSAVADIMVLSKNSASKDPYITETERLDTIKMLNEKILLLANESTNILNPDLLAIPDLIMKKTQQKEQFDLLLKQAILEKDTALISYLTPLVGKLAKEILGLNNQTQ